MRLGSAMILALMAGATPALAQDGAADAIARGKYLATVMDCAGCHMPRGADLRRRAFGWHGWL